ncbi:hypothetical protein JZ785_22615 [Alicyclobacillus curvatus]|nr:hypothetical protein JZ785_22615 [Alicyclobacillus curvatus]
MLIGIDVGSTHCKVGLVHLDGALQCVETSSMHLHQSADGGSFYDPDEVWRAVLGLLETVVARASSRIEGKSASPLATIRGFAHAGGIHIEAIGVASMAESGVLVSRSTGKAMSPLIPWFDQRPAPYVPVIQGAESELALFSRTGLHPAVKHGLTKLLWLKDKQGGISDDAVWLSTADYVVYRLTGVIATDYTLAARTLAFDIRHRVWDQNWLQNFHFNPRLFPEAMPSGTPAGALLTEYAELLGQDGTHPIPVSVSGHDHLCGMVGTGLAGDNSVLNSVGTAETLLGTTSIRELGKTEFHTGLVYGLHVTGDRMYWLGSLPMSGGSVDWARQLLLGTASSYEDLHTFMKHLAGARADAIYVPPLSYLGAIPEVLRHGALFGVTLAHQHTEIFQAVLEGLCFEVEFIRRQAMNALGRSVLNFSAVGGGAKNPHWLQVKANVTGCSIDVLATTESTVVGAALVAARGAGIAIEKETKTKTGTDLGRRGTTVTEPVDVTTFTQVHPDAKQHQDYQHIYESKYLPLRKLVQNGVRT